MNPLVLLSTDILGFFTLIGQGLIAVLVLVLFWTPNKRSKLHKYYLLLKANALTFAFITASSATFGSLFLSEIANFPPCELCWYQRVFMYPIAVILFISLLKNDKGAIKYVIPLAIIGAVVAIYHFFLQLFPNILECSEEVAKCSTVQFAEFGYITIPVMSLTAFGLLILFSLIALKKN